MKKFSDKMKDKKPFDKEDEKSSDKKSDIRSKNDVQPDDAKKKQTGDQKGFSLADDSKKSPDDKVVADDSDKQEKKANKDKSSDGTPDIKLDKQDVDQKKAVGKVSGKTKIDLNPKLELVPADELDGLDEATNQSHGRPLKESRAEKIVRLAREYRGRLTAESIEYHKPLNTTTN